MMLNSSIPALFAPRTLQQPYNLFGPAGKSLTYTVGSWEQGCLSFILLNPPSHKKLLSVRWQPNTSLPTGHIPGSSPKCLLVWQKNNKKQSLRLFFLFYFFAFHRFCLFFFNAVGCFSFTVKSYYSSGSWCWAFLFSSYFSSSVILFFSACFLRDKFTWLKFS